MRWCWIFIPVILLPFELFSQITVNRTHADLGMITEEGTRYADFVFTNKGKKKDFILRINTPREYSSLIQTKTLLPDSSTLLRIQYNPRSTGKFADEFDVYVGSAMEPIKISMSGEIVKMPSDIATNCPDFSNTDIAEQISFLLKIEVVDFYTRKPVPGAQVRITAHGEDIERIKVNSKGTAERKIPLGYYYFITSAENYQPFEFDTFVNRKTNYLLIELEPLKNTFDEPVAEVTDTTPVAVEPIEPVKNPVEVRPMFSPMVLEDVKQDSSITLIIPKDTINEDFPLHEYAANNIVFLVDISSSMLVKGKLDILKASMIKLTEGLRSCDRISVVAYASDAAVIIPSTTGDKKEEIISKIKGLKGGGFTNGAAGLKVAYELAEQHHIKDGNNQVILVTDGMFDSDGPLIMQTVKKNKIKNIKTSVVGIKTELYAERSLKKISDEGGGSMVSIQSFTEGEEKLMEEIRLQSKINP